MATVRVQLKDDGGLARGGMDLSPPQTFTIYVTPVNDAPMAVAGAFSSTRYSKDDPAHEVVVLATNNAGAVVVLDGSLSDDLENEPLEFFWFESGQTVPFATGVRVTNVFEVGTHALVLQVSDGHDIASSVVTLEVITPGEALEDLMGLLEATAALKGKGRPLFATLKAAIASFDRGAMGAGLNQLHAVQNKIRAQVGRTDPLLAEELIRAVQRIVDALMGGARPAGPAPSASSGRKLLNTAS
jgi:hypothetical protein